MYKIIKDENQNVLIINSEDTIGLSLSLNEGGRVKSFVFNGENIITDVSGSEYDEHFASSILFPFANRVEGGEYSFKGLSYKLNCNEKGGKNAIHGLIYNKEFKIESVETLKESASIHLAYTEQIIEKGFPFKFDINLSYHLNAKGLSLKLIIKNNDAHSFPFTTGWHPYFYTENIELSKLNFSSQKRFLSDEYNITKGSELIENKEPVTLSEKEIDRAFTWDSDNIRFITPNYEATLASSSKPNYLQIYKPYQSNIIAIEPMTGISNSLNNGIGLITLNPDEVFEIEWFLSIHKTTNKD